MKIKRKVRIFFAVLVSFITSGFSFALAESNFPVRPIEVVIPLAPGSGPDLSLTPFKDRVGKVLGQPIVVNYRPGAGGTVGTAGVARAKPDGYTLVLMQKACLITAPLTMKGIGYTIDDFTPVCLLTLNPALFYVRDDTPYKNMLDWIEAAKTKRMTYATHGVYTTPHMAMIILEKVAGFKATHVPIVTGLTQITATVLGGHVDMAFTSSAKTMVGPGKLRLIAHTGAKRWELYPDVPPLGELGFEDFKVDWVGAAYWLWAPKGTPKENIDKIYGAFKKVWEENEEELVKIYKNLEYIPSLLGPEKTQQLAQKEYEVIKKIIHEIGVTPK